MISFYILTCIFNTKKPIFKTLMGRSTREEIYRHINKNVNARASEVFSQS
jgi:divalent metal cation (Fe/Co/Zn/Cd) transporter